MFSPIYGLLPLSKLHITHVWPCDLPLYPPMTWTTPFSFVQPFSSRVMRRMSAVSTTGPSAPMLPLERNLPSQELMFRTLLMPWVWSHTICSTSYPVMTSHNNRCFQPSSALLTSPKFIKQGVIACNFAHGRIKAFWISFSVRPCVPLWPRNPP